MTQGAEKHLLGAPQFNVSIKAHARASRKGCEPENAMYVYLEAPSRLNEMGFVY